MAITMSDEELLLALRQMAANGSLVNISWIGFQAVTEARAGRPLSAEETEAIHLAFWAGARCVFDALQRLDGFKLDPQWVANLQEELGNDPFCAPPPRGTSH